MLRLHGFYLPAITAALFVTGSLLPTETNAQERTKSDFVVSAPSLRPGPAPSPGEPAAAKTPDNEYWYLDAWIGAKTPTPEPTPTPTPPVTVTPAPASIVSSCLLTGRIWSEPLPTPTSNGPFEQVEFGTPAGGLDGIVNNTKCWLSSRDLLTGTDLGPFAVGGGVRTEGEVGMSLTDYERHGVICVGIPSIGFYVTCDLEVLY